MVRAYPGFLNMKHIPRGIATSPWVGCYSIAGLPHQQYVTSNQLYTGVNRDNVE